MQVTYKYDAWGNVFTPEGNSSIINANSFLYKGYYYDQETSLYYCNSRYYDPSVGRWISADDSSYLDSDTINGVNLWSYCGNNPVMGYDPDGNAWWHWLIATVAVAILAIGTIVTAGGAIAAYGAVMAALYGVAASSMALTIWSFAFVGASFALATSGLIALSESSSVDDFMDYGENAMWTTIGGGLWGMLGGYLSYKEQIGSKEQARFMTPKEKAAQRRQIIKDNPSINFKGLELSHDYGTYGNNRYHYSFKTPLEHRGPGGFHDIYGYKTNGGPFFRPYPYSDWWWIFRRL